MFRKSSLALADRRRDCTNFNQFEERMSMYVAKIDFVIFPPWSLAAAMLTIIVRVFDIDDRRPLSGGAGSGEAAASVS